ncbi:hypothetical protein MsAg5_01230 [Methanosarcinaceae archaeon Ag5]|uniref:HEPN domain-containing protein n=2 Tax=Methanolapillus africanus TaxID=3028297 RepID=A0AAE4MIQ0_9EURY|nr:hypothetical protein [Methanosarcinaceae archaeon Ag5]
MGHRFSKSKNVHIEVANIYKKSEDEEFHKIGDALHFLKLMRNESDYEEPLNFKLPIFEQTNNAIKEAEHIIEELNQKNKSK